MSDGNRAILKIRWDNSEAVDLIPYEWFGHDVVDEDRCYIITGPRGGNKTKAKCKIEVSENKANLYFGGDNEEYNRRQRIIIGTTRITFHDDVRGGVCKVEWKDDKGGGFEVDPVRKFCLEFEETDRSERQETGKPEKYIGEVILYRRDPEIVKYALDQANGYCGDCKQPAPFKKTSTDEPYLEVHHCHQLAKGGSDTKVNVIALCPNCHRKRHYG